MEDWIQVNIRWVQSASINYCSAYKMIDAPVDGECDEYKSIKVKLGSPKRTDWIPVTEKEFAFVSKWTNGGLIKL